MRAHPAIVRFEEEEITRLAKPVADFAPGDTITVKALVVEGENRREQAFGGVVIAKRNRGLNSSFIVRRVSSGEAVERTFQTHSPLTRSIIVVRRGAVRRAKLYYLRQRSGKSARIREKLPSKGRRPKVAATPAPTPAPAVAAASSSSTPPPTE